jgi:DNA mismatch endonuclease (patch repair protein)
MMNGSSKSTATRSSIAIRPPSPERSNIMRSIKGRGNETTELRLATILRRNGLKGWRRHLKLPGTPDFAWPRERLVVFVDGCFWHGCPRCYRSPSRNSEFWKVKLESNRARDRRVSRLLRSLGWRVLRLWECRITEARTLSRIRAALI